MLDLYKYILKVIVNQFIFEVIIDSVLIVVWLIFIHLFKHLLVFF
jgi:hypothetical protein